MNADIIIVTLFTISILFLFVVIIIAIVLKEEIKNINHSMTMDNVQTFLNDNKTDIYLRDKNCNIYKYHAHIAYYANNALANPDKKLIIDIDKD